MLPGCVLWVAVGIQRLNETPRLCVEPSGGCSGVPQMTPSSCVGSFPSCWKLCHGCAYTCLCGAVCLCQRWAVFHCSVTATIGAVCTCV